MGNCNEKESTQPIFNSGAFKTVGGSFRFVDGKDWDEAKGKNFVDAVEHNLFDSYFLSQARRSTRATSSKMEGASYQRRACVTKTEGTSY